MITGGLKVHQSPWVLTDAANIIFEVAKRRCFITTAPPKEKEVAIPAPVMDVDDEDAWEVLDELDGMSTETKSKGKQKADVRPAWLPQNIQPVLEEQPKWDLLSDILLEIESETIHLSSNKNISQYGTDTVLIMTSSTRSCDLIQDFLNSMDPEAESGSKGRVMMRRRLKSFLGWRRRLGSQNSKTKSTTAKQRNGAGTTSKGKEREDDVSEALRKKDRERAEKSASRRRARGGAPPNTGNGGKNTGDTATDGQAKEVIDVDNLNDMAS